MEHRVEACSEVKYWVSDDPSLIKSIIAGDETRVYGIRVSYGYDPETKVQSSLWKIANSLGPKKCRPVRSNIEATLVVFFGLFRLVRYKFVHTGQTVNRVFDKQVLEKLKEIVRRKRPKAWTSKSWFLRHDNAPARIQHFPYAHFLASKNIPMVPHIHHVRLTWLSVIFLCFRD